MSGDDFRSDDGGRSRSHRPRQRNDCTVRALALATGMPYDAAYDALKNAGRRAGRRFAFRPWAASNTFNGLRFEWQAFQAVRGRPRMTVAEFCAQHPRGTFIARTAKHVFAVTDGGVYDDTRPDDRRCVYGCWSVVPAQAASPVAHAGQRPQLG